MQVTAPDDDVTHGEVPDYPRHEDDQVKDGDDDEGVGVLHPLGPQNNQ